MAYALFILVNAVLFLRPAELVPDLDRLPLYYWSILACVAASIPQLLGLFKADSPLKHPVTLCVLALGVCVTVSHVVQSDLDKTAEESFEFAKVLVYFVLFVALVDTPGKLRFLLAAIIAFGTITAVVTVLEYHDVIEIHNLEIVSDSDTDPETGNVVFFKRLMATGILNDPNEYCVFLGMLSILTLHRLTDPATGFLRVVWAAPLGLFLYGIYLSKSRSGLVAFLVGLIAYGIYAYGAKQALRYGLIVLPLLLIAFAGRQTSISLSSGTGRTRVELWSDWMMDFRGSPVFGVAPKIAETKALPKEMRFEFRHLAHNSFLQAFADLGVVGGMVFLGAFLFAFRTLAQYGFDEVTVVDPAQRRLYPFLLGAVVAYATGMMALSLCYVLPTYVVLALPVAYARMTVTQPAAAPLTINAKALRQLAFASVGFLAFIYVVVRVVRVCEESPPAV